MKDDTVSRVAVIETIKSHFRVDNDLLEVIVYEVAHLPAVQTCEDAVSRADVLETYADLYDVFEDSKAICKELHKVYDRINALPAVQPEPKPDENGSEPFGNAEMLSDRTTDDCISRQSVIDALEKVAELYPWRVPGDRDSYRSYNEAWQDALNRVENEIEALPSAQPTVHPQRTCVNCGRTVNNGGWYADGRTRCPIEEHYALPKDGYCHLWEKRNVTDDDYPERREE